jgi:hypothetical protein
MLGDVIALTVISLLVISPLLGRRYYDEREEQALRLQALLQRKADQRLGGETFLVVTVEPSLTHSGGRVVLSAPPGWDWLVREAWNEVRLNTPAGYDLVVSGADGQERRAAASTRERAASRRATPVPRAG